MQNRMPINKNQSRLIHCLLIYTISLLRYNTAMSEQTGGQISNPHENIMSASQLEREYKTLGDELDILTNLLRQSPVPNLENTSLTRESVHQVFTQTMVRIGQETKLFKRISPALVTWLTEAGFESHQSQVGTNQITFTGRSRGKISFYYPSTHEISIADVSPSALRVLDTLAVCGGLPNSLNIAVHEDRHSAQSYPSVPALLCFILVKLGFIDTALSEADAFSAEKPTIHPTLFNSPTSDMKSRDYGFLWEQVGFTLKAVETLKALDIPEDEIFQIIKSPGKFDSKSRTYPKVKSFLREYLDRQGLTENDIEILLGCEERKQEKERRKTMLIARSGLRRLLNSESTEVND